tara:strand:- start:19682 stop:19816 length:135 start_codon:yes stop_codon:yes gene_type:complete
MVVSLAAVVQRARVVVAPAALSEDEKPKTALEMTKEKKVRPTAS